MRKIRPVIAENTDGAGTYDQRKSPRVNAGGEFVLLQINQLDGKKPDDTDVPVIYAKVVNISEGGLRLDIPNDQNADLSPYNWPPPGVTDTLDLLLTGPSLPKPIHVLGEIVSIGPGNDQTRHSISLKFVNINEHVIEMIRVGLLRMNLSVNDKPS